MNEQNEKIEAGEIVVQSRFVKWLDNYWYHYKWPTIIVAFFLLVGAVSFSQCASNEKYDLVVSYTGDASISQEQQSRLLELFTALAPENEKGTGKQSVGLTTYLIYDPERLKEICTDAEGNQDVMAYTAANQTSGNNFKTFDSYVATGDCALDLVSEYVYKQRPDLGQTMMRPLTSIYGEALPASAYDGYAIRFTETAFYQYYQGVLGLIPEDTLLLIPAKTLFVSEDTYADYEALCLAVLNFQAP